MTDTINRRALLGASGAAFAYTIVMPQLARAQDAKPTAPTTPMPSIETFATPAINSRCVALSPDGKRVAAITPKGEDQIVSVMEIGTTKVNGFNFGKTKARDLLWGDNSHVIMIDSLTISLPEFSSVKSEVSQARNIDITTGKLITFFDHQMEGDRTTGTMLTKTGKFYPIVYSPIMRVKVDGEYRVTAANYRMNDSYNMCLFEFNLQQVLGKLVVAAPTGAGAFVVTPTGEVAAYSVYDHLREEWTLVSNSILGTGHTKFSTTYTRKVKSWELPHLAGLGRDGISVVVGMRTEADPSYQYYEISADGVVSPQLDQNGVGAERFPLFNPTTGRLAGFGRREETLVYDYFDPLMKKLVDALPAMVGEGYRFYPAAYGDDARQMLVYSEGPDDAGTYFFIDFATGKTEQVATVYPDLSTEWITQKQPISYKAADGLEIHGYLTLPSFKAGKNLPLVVLPHGGPEARDTIDFDWQVQILASRGYAVLQPNFRGSDGYGDSFTKAGHGEWGRKMQTDLSDGVRYLVGKGIADPKRVAILGASYGGYAAMAGATLTPGVYNCAVAIAGVSDLKSMVAWEARDSGDDDALGVRYWKEFMGIEAGWDAVSPAKQAAHASCPVLLIHGTDDTVVPIEQSRLMESALKAAGKTVEFVTYPGQDHWETVSSARVDMMKAALAFLTKYNPA